MAPVHGSDREMPLRVTVADTAGVLQEHESSTLSGEFALHHSFVKGDRDPIWPKMWDCVVGNACQCRRKTLLWQCRRRLESVIDALRRNWKCGLCCPRAEMKNTAYSPCRQMLTHRCTLAVAEHAGLALSTFSMERWIASQEPRPGVAIAGDVRNHVKGYVPSWRR